MRANTRFQHSKLFVAGMIILSLTAFVAVAQKRRTASGSAASQSKIDPSKPTRNCTGNFISKHFRVDDLKAQDDNILNKIYDLKEIKRRALSKNYKVVDERPLVPVLTIPLAEFNERFNSGTPMKISDGERILGPFRVRPEGTTHVEMRAPILKSRSESLLVRCLLSESSMPQKGAMLFRKRSVSRRRAGVI